MWFIRSSTTGTGMTLSRIENVDDMICDLLVALSLKRNQGHDRQWIRSYAEHIVRYCDENPPMRVSASGPIRLDA